MKQPHRAPGPELATTPARSAADRQKAQAWTRRFCRSERQSQAHPAQLMRGPGRPAHSQDFDPVTQPCWYTVAGGLAALTGGVDGRSAVSVRLPEHTRDGFSTGVWDNGQLVIHHPYGGVVQRNGAATSPYGDD